jgi:hypothetical protein
MNATTKNASGKRAKISDHEKAVALHAALALVNEASIPVMSRERCIPRTEQAALARSLFKRLGLAGISVTTPNYSMAQVVEVRLPKLEIHCPDMWPHDHTACCYGKGASGKHTEEGRCPACRDNAAAELKVEEILARAFPQHDNRSDTQSDYFDYCWSVD